VAEDDGSTLDPRVLAGRAAVPKTVEEDEIAKDPLFHLTGLVSGKTYSVEEADAIVEAKTGKKVRRLSEQEIALMQKNAPQPPKIDPKDIPPIPRSDGKAN
jgi:hypothetical protein